MTARILFFALILFSSCSEASRPRDVIKADKMSDIYWDQLKADAFVKEFGPKDSSRSLWKQNAVLQEKIFLKHNIARADFFKSHEWYLNHPEQLQLIIDSMISKQNRLHNAERINIYHQLKPL